MGTNNYGFGIENETLQYSSFNFHKFYNSSNNLNTFTIDSTGNITCVGTLNVSGLSRLNRIVTQNNTSPDLTAVNNATTHSMIKYFQV